MKLVTVVIVALSLAAFVGCSLPGQQTPQQQTQSAPAGTSNLLAGAGFGVLPRPEYALADVLKCAGANETLWTTEIKWNPNDPEVSKAKRKAAWYAAVALWIFDAGSPAVVDAVAESRRVSSTDAMEIAKQCREAPENWRE